MSEDGMAGGAESENWPDAKRKGFVRSTILADLVATVGRRHVLTRKRAMRWYLHGYRAGGGNAVAVVRPGSLVELWRVVNLCVSTDYIVVMQAANTSLTGGASPFGDDYDRPVVVVSGNRIAGLRLIDDGRQVLCFPGTTLDQLEKALAPIGREPHSVIGSSCIGASVIGGVCNNSGGALIRRGPAYTELALYARLDADGVLRLVNHLGIDLGDDPEQILANLDRGNWDAAHVRRVDGLASDLNYEEHVRAIDANTPARFNADARLLFEASGCAGKLVLFAVRLDTFPNKGGTRLFYIGTEVPAVLGELRRSVLSGFNVLPVSAEYIHREAFALAEAYGKDMVLAIAWLGTRRLPGFFAVKRRIDALFERLRVFRPSPCDRLLQAVAHLLPSHLPRRVSAFHRRYDHHLLLLVEDPDASRYGDFLQEFFSARRGDFFACTPAEKKRALLHRFVVAGAAVRFRALHGEEVEDIVALDVALRRNDKNWDEALPSGVDGKLIHKLFYGHFFCHVFHRDYVVRKGEDVNEIKSILVEDLAHRGAEYPAEHNVGHVYRAKPALAGFYRQLDPLNALNPGVGLSSRRKGWAPDLDPARNG